MVRSMFSGVSGLRAHQTKMDVIGNNIANVNTYGFKSGRATFSDAFYMTLSGSSAAGGGYGGGTPTQIGYGSQVSSIDVLHTRGSYSPTDNPSDCMINGTGYFLVGPGTPGTTEVENTATYAAATDTWTPPTAAADDSGLKSLNLTRVGIFNFDGSGNLVDPNRNMVYGFMNTSTTAGTATYDYTTLEPISIGDTTLKSLSIAQDGTVTGIDTSDNVIIIGQIAVVNVPNPNALEMTSSSYYKAKSNVGVLAAYTAGAGTTGQIESGGLEMANVDLAKEFSEMITTQRGFQANTRIITVSDEMLQELVNIKR